MPIAVGKSGVHKTMTAGGVGKGGAWKSIVGIWVGRGGAWKQGFAALPAWNPTYIAVGTAVNSSGVLGYAVGTPGTFGSLSGASFNYTGTNGHVGGKTIVGAYVTSLGQVVVRIDGFASAPPAGWLTAASLQMGAGVYTVTYSSAPTFSGGVATWSAVGTPFGSPSAGALNLILTIP